jgi:hypothetical protein
MQGEGRYPGDAIMKAAVSREVRARLQIEIARSAVMVDA